MTDQQKEFPQRRARASRAAKVLLRTHVADDLDTPSRSPAGTAPPAGPSCVARRPQLVPILVGLSTHLRKNNEERSVEGVC